jgi:hypothetical protein
MDEYKTLSTMNLSKLASSLEGSLFVLELDIKAGDLKPNQLILIQFRRMTASNQELLSCASFQTDQSACIDPGMQKHLNGNYDRIGPMGSIWTLEPIEDPD